MPRAPELPHGQAGPRALASAAGTRLPSWWRRSCATDTLPRGFPPPTADPGPQPRMAVDKVAFQAGDRGAGTEGLALSGAPVSHCRWGLWAVRPALQAARALPASVTCELWEIKATGAHRAGQGSPPGPPDTHQALQSCAECPGEAPRAALRPGSCLARHRGLRATAHPGPAANVTACAGGAAGEQSH